MINNNILKELIENNIDDWNFQLSYCCSSPSSLYYTCSKCNKKTRFYDKSDYKNSLNL